MDIKQLNSIKQLLGKNIGIYHDTATDVYEIIQDDTDVNGNLNLDVNELMELNKLGLLFVSQQNDIDYDDEDDNGEIVPKFMDIAYFKYYEQTKTE